MRPRHVLQHLVAALGVFALVACSRQASVPEPIRPVQMTQISLGASGEKTVYAGEVKPRYEGDLGFRIGGKIVARLVDVGSTVQTGQPLARLDPADVGLQTDAAKAQLAAAETEFTFAKAELDRYQGLLEQKFISQSALDSKRNAFNSARAKYDQAKAQLAVARNQASYATLVADRDGVITAVSAEVGQVVQAGQPVLRLAQHSEREVLINVAENRLPELKAARSIAVSLWANPGKIYAGRIREVSPQVDTVTRTFAVRVTVVDADASVRWGMTANVGLQAERIAGVALLPLTAIYQQDGNAAVWIYDPATRQVSLRPVELGAFREDGAVIRSGLNGGEWVVTAGVHKLIPGQVVRPLDTNVAKS